jgi:hypothetical protein
LKHELLHIAFGHLTTFFKFSNKKLANVAMDMEINQYISKQYLPEGGIDIDNYTDIELDRKAGARYYYDKLNQLQDEKDKNGTTGDPNMDQLLDNIENGDIPDHSTWEEFEGLSESEQRVMKAQLDRVLEQAAERYQAGLSLTGDDAMNEYKEAFFGAAAAGGGIGAGAKTIGGYREYRQAIKAEDALGKVRSEKNALDEAGEEDAGVDTGINKQGVPISDQQELDIAAGVRDAGPGDLEGNQLPLSSIGGREDTVGGSLDAKIEEAQLYIRQLQAVDPNDPRIQDAVAYIQQLQSPQAFNAPGAVPPAVTSQEIKQVTDQLYKDIAMKKTVRHIDDGRRRFVKLLPAAGAALAMPVGAAPSDAVELALRSGLAAGGADVPPCTGTGQL